MAKKGKHQERKHSDYSPSAAERWMTCPGSIRLSAGAPKVPPTPASREGTKGHECLEFVVERFKAHHEGLRDFSVRKFKDEIMVDHAMNAAREIDRLKPSRGAELLVERRVEIKGLPVKLFGTLDYAWVDLWGKLIVVDYKYGYHPVSPLKENGEPNVQLMLYALGVCQEYRFDFDHVVLAIVQPRANKSAAPLTHAVSMKQIRTFQKTVIAAVEKTLAKTAELIPGDHCKFCPAAPVCSALNQKPLAEAEILFDIESGVSGYPSLSGLTPKKLGTMLKAADQLEVWITALRTHAFNAASSGQSIEGYSLVSKRPQRHWTQAAEKRALKLFGNKCRSLTLISPAQFEKTFGPAGRKFVDENTIWNSSGEKLVRDGIARQGTTDQRLLFDLELQPDS